MWGVEVCRPGTNEPVARMYVRAAAVQDESLELLFMDRVGRVSAVVNGDYQWWEVTEEKAEQEEPPEPVEGLTRMMTREELAAKFPEKEAPAPIKAGTIGTEPGRPQETRGEGHE